MKTYLVLKINPKTVSIQGVFSKKILANKACRDYRHCYVTLTLNEELPQRRIKANWIFPRSKTCQHH